MLPVSAQNSDDLPTPKIEKGKDGKPKIVFTVEDFRRLEQLAREIEISRIREKNFKAQLKEANKVIESGKKIEKLNEKQKQELRAAIKKAKEASVELRVSIKAEQNARGLLEDQYNELRKKYKKVRRENLFLKLLIGVGLGFLLWRADNLPDNASELRGYDRRG